MIDWSVQSSALSSAPAVLCAVVGSLCCSGVVWGFRRKVSPAEQELARQKALSALGRNLHATQTTVEAARVIAETAREMTPWDAFSLNLFLPDSNESMVVLEVDTARSGENEAILQRRPFSPMMQKVFKEGAQLILRQNGEELAGQVVPFGDKSRRSASLMYVPIATRDRVVGMLSLHSYTVNAFQPEDLATVQTLADHCGGALERIRMESELRVAHAALEKRVEERTAALEKEIQAHGQARRELTQEGYLLQALLQHCPDYIYFKDLEGRFVRANQAFANWFGNCDAEQMTGKTDFDFFSAESARASQEDEQKIIRTGQPLVGKEEHEFWLDGREWWCVTSKLPLRDPAGNIIGIFGLTRDISLRKKAELELQQLQKDLDRRVEERTLELQKSNQRMASEMNERIQAELLSTTFSNLGFHLSHVRSREQAAEAILEAADQFLSWDCAYLHLYSADLKSIIPVVWADILDGRRVIRSNAADDTVLTERDRKIIEEGAELILREHAGHDTRFSPFGDKGRLSLSLMYVPIRSGGKVIGGLSIQSYAANAYTQRSLNMLQGLADFCAGTMERIEAEGALRQSEERFTKAFFSSPVAMMISTFREGRFLDANDHTARITGWQRHEMIGRTAVELGIWSSDAERARFTDLLLAHRQLRDQECDLRHRSGKVRKVLCSAEIFNFQGEEVILTSAYDITDRLHLEEQLRHAQKMEAVGQLAAGIAHDFNNILTIIQGHIGVLEFLPGVSGHESGESISQMSMATERAANLTRQLLAFSRRQVMQPKVMDLNAVIANLGKMVRRLLGESVPVHFDYAHKLGPVHVDPGMIEQVLLNLAVNARDAMPEGGELHIATSARTIRAEMPDLHSEARPGEFSCLEVTDTGCGIPPETLPHIFEPFFTTKDVGKGTGLGLSTVYGIIKQHQGWIEVESTPGKGTTFRICLPVCAEGVLPEEKRHGPSSVRGGQETILVVEDEPALRSLVTSILKNYGYHVLTAAHGKEALTLWQTRQQEVNLLLTDMVMPEGVSGFELSERLRRDKPQLKVIYSSGYSPELFEQKIKLVDGVNFLAKPYRPGLLAKTVRNCLDV